MITFLFITAISHCSLGQQVQEKPVYMYADSSMLENILKARGIAYESISEHNYQIEMNGFPVLITVNEGNLMLRANFSEKPSLETINRFHRKYPWARVYFNENGALTVAQELRFKGGITLENIYAFLDGYGHIISEELVYLMY